MSAAGNESAAKERSRGYTLAELLTVIGIISILAGLSLGVFATLPGKVSHETAASSIRALLRRARASAIESRADAAVTFAGRRVEARAWTPLLLMRFDDIAPDSDAKLELTTGARGVVGRIKGALPAEGKMGGAVHFEAPGSCVDLGGLPIFEARDGLRLEAWVQPGDLSLVRDPPNDGAKHAARPPAPGAKAEDPYLFQVAGKGRSYYLRVREDFALVGGITGAGARAPIERASAPGVLRAGAWTEVALVFDGADLSLWADGFRVDQAPPKGEKLPVEVLGDPRSLVVSSEDAGLTFLGAIDEVRLFGITAEEGFDVAEDVAVDAPQSLRFDARGALDSLYHEGPQTITVRRIVRSADPKLSSAQATSGTAITITVERTGALTSTPAGGTR